MTPQFVSAVEKALDAHGREIVAMKSQLLELAKSNLQATREGHAAERMLIASVLLAAETCGEAPLAYLARVRKAALDPLVGDDLVVTREIIEGLLAKLEGAIIRRQDGEVGPKPLEP